MWGDTELHYGTECTKVYCNSLSKYRTIHSLIYAYNCRKWLLSCWDAYWSSRSHHQTWGLYHGNVIILLVMKSSESYGPPYIYIVNTLHMKRSYSYVSWILIFRTLLNVTKINETADHFRQSIRRNLVRVHGPVDKNIVCDTDITTSTVS